MSARGAESAGLGAAERRAIEAERAHYEDARAAGVEALRIVQHHHGWVSDAHLAAVADLLGLSVHELDGVATFYSQIYRRPVGRHVLLLCDSVSCWICGAEPVREHLRRRLGVEPGQTTPDGRFTLLPATCLGACERAPALLVGDRLHGDLDPARVDALLAELP